MSIIGELIRVEESGNLSFGNYELREKTKLSDFEHDGDMYKVKTFSQITKLEKNGILVYESVPGTAVSGLAVNEGGMCFTVEGNEDAQVTVEMEADTQYQVCLGGAQIGDMKTNLGGKLSFSVELEHADAVKVEIKKI